MNPLSLLTFKCVFGVSRLVSSRGLCDVKITQTRYDSARLADEGLANRSCKALGYRRERYASHTPFAL
jgi:hypothetical protein